MADVANPIAVLREERDTWDARCHFCGGPSYAWMTDDETWALVEPLLGQSQACFECFGAAWMILGLNDGEPFLVLAPSRAVQVEALVEAARRLDCCADLPDDDGPARWATFDAALAPFPRKEQA